MYGSMEELCMIHQKDLDQLIQYYKGKWTENALLNKVATLAAKKHLLLADPQQPAALVNVKTKPLSQELTKLMKQIGQFPGGVGVGAPAAGAVEEDEGYLVMGPVEQWLKCMIKGSPSTPKPQITPGLKSSGPVKKAKASTSQVPIRKGKASTSTPLTSRGDSDLAARLEAIRERCTTLEEMLAASLGKGVRKVEQLKPLLGWEDWAQGKKVKRCMEYLSD